MEQQIEGEVEQAIGALPLHIRLQDGKVRDANRLRAKRTTSLHALRAVQSLTAAGLANCSAMRIGVPPAGIRYLCQVTVEIEMARTRSTASNNGTVHAVSC